MPEEPDIAPADAAETPRPESLRLGETEGPATDPTPCVHCGAGLGCVGAKVCKTCRLAQTKSRFYLDHRLSLFHLLIALFAVCVGLSRIDTAEKATKKAEDAIRDAKAATELAVTATAAAKIATGEAHTATAQAQTAIGNDALRRQRSELLSGLYLKVLQDDDRHSYDLLIAQSKEVGQPETHAVATFFVGAIQAKYTKRSAPPALKRFPKPPSTCEAIRLLQSPDKFTRAAAASIVGAQSPPARHREPIEALGRTILRDPSIMVVHTAIHALRPMVDQDLGGSYLDIDWIKKELAALEPLTKFPSLNCPQ